MKNLVLLFLVVISSYEVRSDNPLETGVKKLEDVSRRIKRDAEEVESALAPTVARLHQMMGQGRVVGQQGVKNVYGRAIQHLDTVPPHCVEGVKSNLLQLQSAADRTFLSCSNLTMAVQDMGNLVVTTGDMLLGLARAVQEMTWFTNCFSWNPLKSLPCFFEWIGLLFQGTKGLISSLSNFNSELDSTLVSMLKVINFCQARTMNQHDVLAVMSPVHQCANQPVPHHMYQIDNNV